MTSMEAPLVRCALLAAAVASLGASHRTQNFVVEAPTPAIAQQIGSAAERYRHDLAIEWVGREMPNWAQPCPITAQVADHLGAGGATSFVFEHGEVFGWRMTIQGSLVRILDSVLPHEITHTIFATHFRQPLPRWADEGACTTVEHASERGKQQAMLIDFLRTGRGIAFNRMFAMKDYPHDVMPLYSQGYSLARYLVAQGGKRKFLDYLADGMSDENWTRATNKHYGATSLSTLQNTWLDWVRKGSPALDATKDSDLLVAVKLPGPSPEPPRPSDSIRPGPVDDAPERKLALADGRGASTASVYEKSIAAGDHESSTVSKSSDESWRSPRAPSPDAIARVDAVRVGPADEPAPERSAGGAYQVTRPQAVQRPRQVILEWSKPPGKEASGGESAPAER